MERSSTGDEYDDVPRDIGKRMHSVGQREAHSNSKVIYSNLEPKQNNRTMQIPRFIAAALFFQLVLIYWVVPRASIKWPNLRMLRVHRTDTSATSHNGQPFSTLRKQLQLGRGEYLFAN